ncbi:MAG: hypothetical protein AAFZ18_39825, partial [Myxococcota bacterium]
RRVGEFGVVLEVVVQDDCGEPKDISSATTLSVTLVPPPNSGLSPRVITATFTTDGTDGRFRAKTTPTDLTVPGRWAFFGEYAGPDERRISERYFFDVVEP